MFPEFQGQRATWSRLAVFAADGGRHLIGESRTNKADVAIFGSLVVAGNQNR